MFAQFILLDVRIRIFINNLCSFIDVESDEDDELEFVQEYDMDEDVDNSVDEEIAELITTLPNDASASTGFGKREFTFSKVLTISKNRTKTFTKIHESLKVDGSATTSIIGNYNTSLDVSTSASGKFAVNVTASSKGNHVKTFADGKVLVSSSSKSKIAKKRLVQQAFVDSSTVVNIPALNNQVVLVNSSIRSGSETFKLPFRSYLTLFKSGLNTTTGDIIKTKAVLAGEVLSRVVFANKTVSLTKSFIKGFVKSKSTVSIDNTDEDDLNFEERFYDSADENVADDATSSNVFQISLFRAKTHTWTKVVSQSKSQVVVDVISCTKTRVYGKSIQKGVSVVYAGTGQVAWEKSRITISAKRLQNLSPHEYGIHFVNKQLESSSLIQLDTLGKLNNKNQLKMTMWE